MNPRTARNSRMYRTNKNGFVPVTIKLTPVELGTIDFLASGGLGNRSHWIRVAIARRLADERVYIDRQFDEGWWQRGSRRVTADELEAAAERGERLTIRQIGLLEFAPDVDALLASRTLGYVAVYGVVRAPPGVREVLDAL